MDQGPLPGRARGRLPDAYTVDVRFKLPMLLPAKVGLRRGPSGDGWEFSVAGARDGKPHLTGRVSER